MTVHILKNKTKFEIIMSLFSIFCFCLIFFLSSKSKIPQPIKPFYGLDKILHCIAFGTLAFSFSFWFSYSAWNERKWKYALITFSVIALYGISDELHQFFVPGRSASIYDWFADCTGAIIACSLRLIKSLIINSEVNK